MWMLWFLDLGSVIQIFCRPKSFSNEGFPDHCVVFNFQFNLIGLINAFSNSLRKLDTEGVTVDLQ